MTDLGSVQAKERKAWAGMCLGIVDASKHGAVKVKAESEGLEPAEIVLSAK